MKLDLENAIMADAFMNLCNYINETVQDEEVTAESKVRRILHGVEHYKKDVNEQVEKYCKR